MWCFNQGCWAWFEVVLRKPLPEPSPGAMVLFLHIVPIIAAVALRPHQADEREGMVPSALNVLILLVWWIVVYAFLFSRKNTLSRMSRPTTPAGISSTSWTE